VWVAKGTYSGVNALDVVDVGAGSSAGITDPGNLVSGVDFIRFVESATYLP
jgi:hypothetical protein